MKLSKTTRLRSLLLWSIFPILLVSSNAFAQTAKVSGTIVNQLTSAPVSGATITVKSSSRATVTDEAGRFSIDASIGEILIVSSVGYLELEVKITSGSINIQLAEAYNQMDNVVVIGYGSQKKKLVTGANFQVKGDDLQKQNTTNAWQALQGQAPGVQITSSSGQPGSGFNIIIRGKGTIGSFWPLVVVDGVQGVDIANINPADMVRKLLTVLFLLPLEQEDKIKKPKSLWMLFTVFKIPQRKLTC